MISLGCKAANLKNNPVGTDFIHRRRLIHAIENSGNELLLVYGPAGYGKSVVVRQWADEQKRPVVWFEGFASTNTKVLITEIIDSIKTAIPELQEKLENLVIPVDVNENFISSLYEILSKYRNGFVFVVDQAEVIRKAHNHISRLLITLLPRNIKLIVILSAVPTSSFSKELGMERFSVLTPSDLEFTFDEFHHFAEQVSQNITKWQLQEIYDLTGGWPAGIHLALAEIKFTENPRDIVSTFQNLGKKKFSNIANREISMLSDMQRDLLSRLCLLPTIDSNAAISITDDEEVMRKLTLISQETAILSQSSYNPPSFTLNPIIRRYFIDQLQSDSNFKIKSERVLEYLIDSGDVRSATKVLLELGSVKRLSQFLQEESVSRTIDSSIQDSIMRSSVQEIRDWIPIARWSGDFCDVASAILNFYAELLSGNFVLANSQVAALNDAINSLDSKMAEDWKVDLLAIKSISFYAQGRLEDSFQCAMEAAEKSSNSVNTRRHHQLNYLQVALWAAFICDDDTKVRKIQDLLETSIRKDSLRNRNSSIQSLLALIAAFQGRIIEAKNLYVTPISKITFEYYEGFFGNYGVKMAESLVSSEAGNLKHSISILEDAKESARKSNNFPILIAFLGRLSYMYLLESNSEISLGYISEARELINHNSLSDELHAYVDIWEMRVRNLLLDHERARELLKRSRNTYLTRAFAAAIEMNGNPKKALQLIETFDLEVPRQKLTYHLFRAHIFNDNPRAQMDEVKKAVEVGSKHGYFHHFLTQRSDVIQQYISLAAEFPTAFNERLARAAGEKLNEMMVGNQSAGESLTRREADILRHLATGLPLKDIAGNLNISKNTIKTHLKNLYRKLGAKDREDAVEKGRRLLKV